MGRQIDAFIVKMVTLWARKLWDCVRGRSADEGRHGRRGLLRQRRRRRRNSSASPERGRGPRQSPNKQGGKQQQEHAIVAHGGVAAPAALPGLPLPSQRSGTMPRQLTGAHAYPGPPLAGAHSSGARAFAAAAAAAAAATRQNSGARAAHLPSQASGDHHAAFAVRQPSGAHRSGLGLPSQPSADKAGAFAASRQPSGARAAAGFPPSQGSSPEKGFVIPAAERPPSQKSGAQRLVSQKSSGQRLLSSQKSGGHRLPSQRSGERPLPTQSSAERAHFGAAGSTKSGRHRLGSALNPANAPHHHDGAAHEHERERAAAARHDSRPRRVSLEAEAAGGAEAKAADVHVTISGEADEAYAPQPAPENLLAWAMDDAPQQAAAAAPGEAPHDGLDTRPLQQQRGRAASAIPARLLRDRERTSASTQQASSGPRRVVSSAKTPCHQLLPPSTHSKRHQMLVAEAGGPGALDEATERRLDESLTASLRMAWVRKLLVLGALCFTLCLWVLLAFFVLVYGRLLLDQNDTSEGQFLANWGAGLAIDNATQWKDIATQVLEAALVFLVLDAVGLVPLPNWVRARRRATRASAAADARPSQAAASSRLFALRILPACSSPRAADREADGFPLSSGDAVHGAPGDAAPADQDAHDVPAAHREGLVVRRAARQ